MDPYDAGAPPASIVDENDLRRLLPVCIAKVFGVLETDILIVTDECDAESPNRWGATYL